MTTIKELRILPPFAIARVGSAAEPLENYELEADPKEPLGFRLIKPASTLIVDEVTHAVRQTEAQPAPVRFKEDGRIKPVAPFLEVFILTDKDELEPLTLKDLPEQEPGKLARDCVTWCVRVANRKVWRRTEDEHDVVTAHVMVRDHDAQPLEGTCDNFVDGGLIQFGSVQFIRPTAECPQIRLRFTPGKGAIYGAKVDEVVDKSRVVYDIEKSWVGYSNATAEERHNETLPPSLYAINPPAPPWLNKEIAISRGYFDDTCDGFVEVTVTLKDGRKLTAKARICSGPPALVPDSSFIRTLADDLDQVIFGREVPCDEPLAETRKRALDIVRRAYETVRFMNVALLNGNPFKGFQPDELDTMPEDEGSVITERPIRPVMPPATVDTLTILALHKQIYTTLESGAAAWFLRILRKPEEAADFTDRGRRKMPALMCGADNNYLALTYRQLDTIKKAADPDQFIDGKPSAAASASESTASASDAAAAPATQRGTAGADAAGLKPRNLAALRHQELERRVQGNPQSTRVESAIANCCPGLETDFRAAWRRMFKGIVLREYDNLVVEVDLDAPDKMRELKGHRLLCVGDIPVIATMIGPVPGNPQLDEPLKTKSNPHAIAPLEWSNLIARIVNGCVEEGGPTRTVKCYFTEARCEDHHEPWVKDCGKYIEVDLELRPFFEKETAVISEALAHPGELTQGLCSPWQNDYRECSCYYWASARPDYINVEPTPDGLSTGDNWLQKKRTGDYVPDDYVNPDLVLYNDLFSEWEKWLRFQIGGRDAPGEATPVPPANVDENEIRTRAAARAEAFDRKDLEASLAFYAPDAMILWPGAPVASGADALRKKLREKLSDPTLRIQFASKSITLSKAKDFASDFGEVTFMSRDARTNKPVYVVQKYVVVWRKICDEWKVTYDAYNADAW